MSAETIFVSYSSKDRPFALGLVKELQSLGANVWIDQLGIGLGENWDNAIEEALEKSGTFMLILSQTSVESPNVQDEVSIAINTKKKMVPILIEECKLPMRWQRRQYADLANNPDKAIHDILSFLGLQEKAAANLKKILNLIGVSEAPQKESVNTDHTKSDEIQYQESNLEDLLVSKEEIDKASEMHKKAISKNKQLIIFVIALSVILLGVLLSFNLDVQTWMIVVGCLSISFLAVRPIGANKKRARNIELMGLLKLKRERLTRVMNRLSNKEIEDFNNEFYNYITL
ncbi:toll/interleukin-1 receptor domain-containing protein [Pontimicrobium aquaticum]|uniref:Toll/interleukin-1 receptor domain-containing protein n=1 Tax=Pontimicrobium aquaticum TaxID=2565367 RepID=A0A4U0EL28_9FLAO|nr:toll/interleukin-1 receptor domain-containing protein [Pontimicrobium aquaticum]TJY32161.1 toll/interleukin-1 receptor domain-containing protein [Pontimicrobium aquaticum]